MQTTPSFFFLHNETPVPKISLSLTNKPQTSGIFTFALKLNFPFNITGSFWMFSLSSQAVQFWLFASSSIAIICSVCT